MIASLLYRLRGLILLFLKGELHLQYKDSLTIPCLQECAPVLSMMAEHVLETDIITIIPTFYNYQDIRTFYTVNTSQIFKVH